jgi:transposase
LRICVDGLSSKMSWKLHPNWVPILERELDRASTERRRKRLETLLLITKGWTCPKAAEETGVPTRTVQSWVKGLIQPDLKGSGGKKRGPPPLVTDRQIEDLRKAIERGEILAGRGGVPSGWAIWKYFKEKAWCQYAHLSDSTWHRVRRRLLKS